MKKRIKLNPATFLFSILAAAMVISFETSLYAQELTDVEKGETVVSVMAATDWGEAASELTVTRGVITWTNVVDSKQQDGKNSTTYKLTEKVTNRKDGKTAESIYEIDGEIVEIYFDQTADGKECQRTWRTPIQFRKVKTDDDFRVLTLMMNKKLNLARFSIPQPTPFPEFSAPPIESNTCGNQIDRNPHEYWLMSAASLPTFGATKSRLGDLLNRWKPKTFEAHPALIENIFAGNATKGKATLETNGNASNNLIPMTITVEWDLSTAPVTPTKKTN